MTSPGDYRSTLISSAIRRHCGLIGRICERVGEQAMSRNTRLCFPVGNENLLW